MFARDRNCFGGGHCLYVKDSIVFKELTLHRENIDTAVIDLEINIRTRKRLIIDTYKPLSQNDSLCSENMSKNLYAYLYLKDYDNRRF